MCFMNVIFKILFLRQFGCVLKLILIMFEGGGT